MYHHVTGSDEKNQRQIHRQLGTRHVTGARRDPGPAKNSPFPIVRLVGNMQQQDDARDYRPTMSFAACNALASAKALD
jgi:hypothetical protein